MKKKVSMQDIADSVGVSKVTVSKVLRGKNDVSETMCQKILSEADRLGYVYSKKAAPNGVSKIAVLTAEHFFGGNNCFYVKLYKYLSEALEKMSIDAVLSIVDQFSEENLVIPEKVKNRETDGVIIMGQLSRSYVAGLTALQIPLVFLDFYYDGFDVTSINTDNFFNMYEMTNLLIRAGHTKIGFVGNLSYTSSIQDRFLGYCKSLLEHGIPLNRSWLLDDRESNGTYVVAKLPQKMPTAFVCNCDEVAMLFIQNLKEHGYRVPEDVSVTGFDDSGHSLMSVPTITTVHVNLEEMAFLAAKAIVKDIGSKKPKNRILLKGTLVARDSVRALPETSGGCA